MQLDIFEEHKEDDGAELSHRLTDIQVSLEYPLILGQDRQLIKSEFQSAG